MDNLEVLDGCLSDAAVEIEDVALGVLIPHRRFITQIY